MKKALALVLSAGAFLAFPALANIFENSTTHNPEPQTTCLYNGDSISIAVEAKKQSMRDKRKPCDPSNRYCESQYSFGGTDITYYEESCYAEFTYTYTQTDTYSGDQSTVRGDSGVWGDVEEADLCPPTDAAGIQHTFKKGDKCYNPNELSENSSCPKSTGDTEYLLPASGTTQSHVCVSHSDGSRCSYNLSSDSSYYTADFENSQCYGQSDELPSPDNPPDGYCTGSGDMLMCNENRSNVCDSDGNCQTGCGSYSYDGVEAFVCFASDTDRDGVPNYSDTDIDGDGIPNTEDEDWDGDGINDPAYGSGRDGSAGTQTGNENTGNNQTGGNGESGPGIEELKEEFIEQGDFSTSEIEKLMSDARDSNNNAIDSLIESDQANFSNAIGESSISSDLDVSELFNSGCSASFKIPFSNSNLDMCEAADRARPFLYVIFALSTFVFCSRQIVNTVRGTD